MREKHRTTIIVEGCKLDLCPFCLLASEIEADLQFRSRKVMGIVQSIFFNYRCSLSQTLKQDISLNCRNHSCYLANLVLCDFEGGFVLFSLKSQ